MAQRVTHLFSCPDVFARLASAAGAALVSWRQDGVGAALRSVNTKLREIVCVEDYRQTGEADDTQMLMRAAAEIRRRGGGTLWFKHGQNYNVWSDGVGGAALFALSNTRGVTVFGNGATITNASASVISSGTNSVFQMLAATNFYVEGLKYQGVGNTSLPVGTTLTDRFVTFGGGCNGIAVRNCEVYNANMGVGCIDDTAANFNVSVENCWFQRVFYPLPMYCTSNVKASFVAYECGRSYFPVTTKGFGCHNHDITIWSRPGYTDAEIFLNVLSLSTKSAEENSMSNIEVNYYSGGRAAGVGNQSSAIFLVVMGQGDGTTSAGALRNVRFNFDIQGLNSAGASADKPARIFEIIKSTASSTPDGTARGHAVTGITLSGSARNWNNSGAGLEAFALFNDVGAAGYNWTGDVTENIVLSNVYQSGNPPGGSLAVDGRGSVAGAPFLTLRDTHLAGSATFTNCSTAAISEDNFAASNVDAASRLYTSGTPVITFATPGNLSVAYSSQQMEIYKRGREVTIRIFLLTSSFTHTTASGNLRITGLGFTCNAAQPQRVIGACYWEGITKAGYSDVNAVIQPGNNYIELVASGSGAPADFVDAGDMPSGGSVSLDIQLTFRV